MGYKGYDIMFYQCGIGRTEYYYIAKDLKQVSFMAMHTTKACQNVLDTWDNSLNYQQKYRKNDQQ